MKTFINSFIYQFLCHMVDFYYELKKSDGTISRVVAEVKPDHETKPPKIPTNPTAKQLKNFEYSLKEYSKNLDKWKHMIVPEAAFHVTDLYRE